jgi:two-component system, OmpR family, response regulator QseB
MRILLVEDNEILGDGLYQGLKQHGYTVDWLKDGLAANYALEHESFDVVVLDLGLPKRSGIDVLKQMRQHDDNTPVLILTARDTIEDQIQGLEVGADHYIIKPVDLKVLVAKIVAVHRRSQNRTESNLEIGQLTLDPLGHVVMVKGKAVTFNRREFALLHKLMLQPERVVKRELLLQTLYGWDEEIDSNALEVHIYHLRRKLKEVAEIKTVRGVGYMIQEQT